MIEKFKSLHVCYKILILAAPIFGMFLTFGGVVIKVEDRYAHADTVKKQQTEIMKTLQMQQMSIEALNERIDIESKVDDMRNAQERIWALEAHYEGKQMPIHIKQEIQHLNMRLRELQSEVYKTK